MEKLDKKLLEKLQGIINDVVDSITDNDRDCSGELFRSCEVEFNHNGQKYILNFAVNQTYNAKEVWYYDTPDECLISNIQTEIIDVWIEDENGNQLLEEYYEFLED